MKTYDSPYTHFEVWFKAAKEIPPLDPYAMVLATADMKSKPSARMVLFKGLIDDTFTFYTNYNSRKGQEITANNQAAILFYWQVLDQQIRIEGSLEKLPREKSENYFASRSFLSQVSSYISQQSREIPSYQKLKKDFQKEIEKHQGRSTLPCTEHWGGYALTPSRFEFYIGREHRLNERATYQKDTTENWQLKYLSP